MLNRWLQLDLGRSATQHRRMTTRDSPFEPFDPAHDPWPTLAVDALHLWLLRHRHGQRSIDALRTNIARYLDLEPASVDLQRSETGRPILASPVSDLQFSASHSGDLLLLGFARGGMIGVDIEHLKLRPNALELARRFFAQSEADALAAMPQSEHVEAFYRLWTAKEASLKALGRGLSHGLDRVVFDLRRDGLQPVGVSDVSEPVNEQADAFAMPGPNAWNLREYMPLPGYRACIAWPGATRRVCQWRID